MFKMGNAIILDWTGTLYERHKGIFPFAKEVIEKLKAAYKIGLISKSSDPEKRRFEVENSGLIDYFDYLKIVEKKGTKEFLECIAELESTPEETLVIDDRMSRGIVTGNKLGCKTYWIQKGDRSFDKPTDETGQPDYKINNLKELINLL